MAVALDANDGYLDIRPSHFFFLFLSLFFVKFYGEKKKNRKEKKRKERKCRRIYRHRRSIFLSRVRFDEQITIKVNKFFLFPVFFFVTATAPWRQSLRHFFSFSFFFPFFLFRLRIRRHVNDNSLAPHP